MKRLLSMMRAARDEAGTVTAEFAVVVPAVIIVLAICLSALHIAEQQLQLQSSVFDAARLMARGEPGAEAGVDRAIPGARVTSSRVGQSVCATATARTALGVLGGFTLVASGCALDESG